ncbi:MAG: hypothetical protein ACRC0Q_11060 [Kurthia gibsonii]
MEVILKLPNNQPFPIKCSQNKNSNASIINVLEKSNSNFMLKTKRQLIIKTTFWNEVPNIIRYRFQYKNNNFICLHESNNLSLTTFNCCDRSFEINKFRKIVIILESPHVDEYAFSMIPIAPAQGVTGRKINSNIENLLKKIKNQLDFIDNEIIEVALVNPIPLQTSLGTIHKKSLKGKYCTLRNNVWKCIWKNTDYKEKFINLINTLHSRDIIINACTSTLKNKVSTALLEAEDFKGTIFNTNHPSARRNWLKRFDHIR